MNIKKKKKKVSIVTRHLSIARSTDQAIGSQPPSNILVETFAVVGQAAACVHVRLGVMARDSWSLLSTYLGMDYQSVLTTPLCCPCPKQHRAPSQSPKTTWTPRTPDPDRTGPDQTTEPRNKSHQTRLGPFPSAPTRGLRLVQPHH